MGGDKTHHRPAKRHPLTFPRLSVVRRARWGLADQALSSATNFALLVIVARSVSPSELGGFALFLAGYTALTFVVESLVSEPIVVRYSAVAREQWRRGVSSATGCTCAASVAISIGLALAAVGVQGPIRWLLLIGAACAPGLLLQDTMRFAFFAAGTPKQAFWNDALWAALQVSTILALEILSVASLPMLVLGWAGAGALSGAVSLLQARVLPRPLRSLMWLREQRDLSGYILGERLVGQGAFQLSFVLIAALAGLPAAAAVRSAQSLYGPLNTASSAARIILLPHLVTSQSNSIRRIVRIMVVGIASAAAFVGIVAIALPGRIGSALYGQTWALATPLFAFVAVDTGARMASEAWRVGLLSLASVRRSLVAQLMIAPASVSAIAIGAHMGAARGAVVASAAVSSAGMFVWRHQFVVASSR
jgi:hypothetical protein